MLECLDGLRELTFFSVFFRLLLAMVCGGLIGLERGLHRRAAGFRTYMLVCIGAALTMLLAEFDAHMLKAVPNAAALASIGVHTDVSRFGARVISGIGFLGAGTVIVTSQQKVEGLTTAAGLWASSCMGLAIGAGFFECVILSFVLILFCILVLPKLELMLVVRARNINLYIEYNDISDLSSIVFRIKEQDVHIYDVDIDYGKGGFEHPSAVFTLRTKHYIPHDRIISAVASMDCVNIIDEI